MGMMRPGHLVVLALVVLLLFGARRLPDLARSVGASLRIFKHEVEDLQGGTDRPLPADLEPVPTAGTAPAPSARTAPTVPAGG